VNFHLFVRLSDSRSAKSQENICFLGFAAFEGLDERLQTSAYFAWFEQGI